MIPFVTFFEGDPLSEQRHSPIRVFDVDEGSKEVYYWEQGYVPGRMPVQELRKKYSSFEYEGKEAVKLLNKIHTLIRSKG